jgi:transcriptional regulator with XRE-family HTH domain
MLRHFRIKAGLTQDQLGGLAHVSGKLISAYENGWRVPTRPTTADIDAVPQMCTCGALTELWDQYQEAMSYHSFPDWYQDWPEVEATASRLRWFEPDLVPGLFQTESYATAVYRTRFGISADELDRLVAARLGRQEILTREHPVPVWVLVDEWALRRPVGGSHVMLEQLGRLIEEAGRPSTAIQIIPASTGMYYGLNAGGFMIADFDGAPGVAYKAVPVRGQQVRDPQEVAALSRLWDTVVTSALPLAASLALLEEAAKSWTSQM